MQPASPDHACTGFGEETAGEGGRFAGASEGRNAKSREARGAQCAEGQCGNVSRVKNRTDGQITDARPCIPGFRREIAKMVVQRAGALDHNGASPSLQACAQDVGDNCAVLGEEVRELLRKLAAEKVA